MDPTASDRITVLAQSSPAVAVSAVASANFQVGRAAYHLRRMVELGEELDRLLPEVERSGRRIEGPPVTEARQTVAAARAGLAALESARERSH